MPQSQLLICARVTNTHLKGVLPLTRDAPQTSCKRHDDRKLLHLRTKILQQSPASAATRKTTKSSGEIDAGVVTGGDDANADDHRSDARNKGVRKGDDGFSVDWAIMLESRDRAGTGKIGMDGLKAVLEEVMTIRLRLR